MELGIIGLGRMGANMARRLLASGHRVVANNRSPGPIDEIAQEGAVPAYSPEELVRILVPPRSVWVMVPAGGPTEQMVEHLAEILSPGDTVVDGGNSYYRDSVRRYEELKSRGLNFVDVGTSGGVWGLSEGYSLMVGGESEPVERLRPVFESLAPGPNEGWGHLGPAGAGHFAKMVHNGIEYGMMQAYAEGFDLLRSKEDFPYDLHQVAQVWQSGSVVRSWLLDLTAAALEEDSDLTDIRPWVADSGEGRWTVMESVDLAVPAPVISLALQMRFASRRDDSYAAKLLAALRNQFGGHAVQYVEPVDPSGSEEATAE
ncbi:MAG: decarboxylating 6-phosphogluconate dehydrogenase [Thermoleophilia bacterium]